MQMSRAGWIAIAAAFVAVVTSLIAIIVVVRQPEPAVAAPEPPRKARDPVKSRKVSARDVLELPRAVTPTRDRKTSGIEIDRKSGAALADALGLDEGDIVVAISGRKVASERDVADALAGIRMMEAMTIYVDVVRDGEPVLVRWEVDEKLRRTASTDAPAPPSDPDLVPSAPDPLVDTIRKIDELTYEVPRATVDAFLANPMALTKGARVVPSMKNGKPNGMKLYAIRPTSGWAHVGFHNGDTVHSVNGHDLTSPDKALEMYSSIRASDDFRVEITRRGKPVTLSIKITK
ncbi:MAG: hypothetical protein KF773_10200 [Deltaproteobacteria bacterium]|nr:hypothetical protein [Deltaproteobacteria bacterium]MCW5802829.1 hypothetical protein [Deltaproteobacteria bacterium]